MILFSRFPIFSKKNNQKFITPEPDFARYAHFHSNDKNQILRKVLISSQFTDFHTFTNPFYMTSTQNCMVTCMENLMMPNDLKNEWTKFHSNIKN